MDKNELIPENNENKDEALPAEEQQNDTAEAEETENTAAEAEATEEAADAKNGTEEKDTAVTERKVTTESVDFSAGDIITVVAQNDKKKNNLPVIIAACVLAVVVIIAVVLFFVKSADTTKDPDNAESQSQEDTADHYHNPYEDLLNEALTEVITDVQGNTIDREEYIEHIKQQVQEATTTLSNNVGTESPNQIVENTTQAVGNGTQAENKEQVDKAKAQINAFFERSCYIQGAMYSGGTGDPLAMSFNGDEFEILTNLDGTEVSIMRVAGVMYIKRPATKQYVELTDSAMDMLGLDPEMFNLSIGGADFTDMDSKLYATYDITVNGEKGVCHEYVNSGQTFKFYSVDGQLKQIDTCDESGEVVSQIMVSYFSESIPGDQMTLKGYEKSSITALFADML
ncbi:MAG: hypothetical protein IJ289_09205 [Clostridia bacterium]|nr:hypothetical protein [Clostridia bacterium]